MNYFSKYPLAKLGFFVLPLIICVALMGMAFPVGGINGFKSIVIAMEFMRSFDDLISIFGQLNVQQIEGLKNGNYIDFVFMLAYSSFFFMFFRRLTYLHSFDYSKIGQFLAIIMVLCDAVENIQLLQLGELYPLPVMADIGNMLIILKLATWSKWLSITICLALIGTALWEYYGLGAKMLSLLLSVPTLLSTLSLVDFKPAYINWFTQSIFISIGLLVVTCFFLKPVTLRMKN